jgi:hypothetical protein
MRRLALFLLAGALYAQTPVAVVDATGTRVNPGDSTNRAIRVVCVNPATQALQSCAGSGGGGGGSTDLTGINGVTPSVGSGATDTGTLRVVLGATQPTLTINLPTGAATSSNQTTANTSLGNIETYTSRIPALGQALAAASVPVVLTAAQLSTLTPLSSVGVSSVPSDPFGANADAASATGSISAKLRFIAATGIPVTSLPSVTIGTFPDNEPFNVAQYGGVAVGAANAVHVQPGTGAVFAASQSGTWNVGTVTTLTSITNAVTVSQGTAANLNATVVNGGTFAVQPASATAPVSTMNSASANSGINAAAAFVFDDTSPTAITENSFGFGRMSANRNQYVTLRDAAGNERGLNIDAANSLLANPGTSANWGIGATGSAQPANANLIGYRTSGATGGVMQAPIYCDQTVSFNGTASAQVITGVASRKVYICSAWFQMNGGANTVSVVSGTGSTCGTGTTAIPGMDGSTTAANGLSLAANSGIVLGGSTPIAIVANNADNVCVLVGGATRVVGGFSYAIL